jgi:hypothetical protein
MMRMQVQTRAAEEVGEAVPLHRRKRQLPLHLHLRKQWLFQVILYLSRLRRKRLLNQRLRLKIIRPM